MGKKSSKQSPVQIVIGTLYTESMTATGHSWTRLNCVLREAMQGLITSGVKFEVDDVDDALSNFGGSYWASCESWYSSACGGDGSGGNLSATISLEKHLDRTPFIWAERTKTPERLHVGSELTWKGERVTVTSFDDKAKTLTACSYQNEKDSDDENDDQVGQRSYILGNYRIVEARTDYEDGSFVARFGPKVEYETRKVKKRFCITNEEMQTVRADYDARRRKHEKAIKAAATLDELDAAKEAAQAEGQTAYRHFDLEIIGAAIEARREAITDALSEAEAEIHAEHEAQKSQARMAQWLVGEDVKPYFSGIIQLRIKGSFVECSNGNKVSLDAAFKTLPLVHRCREKGWERNGQVHDVDAFRLERIDERGVLIGCTLISWQEVDRFTPILKKAKRTKGAS
jgi:hypothetical protein